jgi:hypothetical protein
VLKWILAHKLLALALVAAPAVTVGGAVVRRRRAAKADGARLRELEANSTSSGHTVDWEQFKQQNSLNETTPDVLTQMLIEQPDNSQLRIQAIRATDYQSKGADIAERVGAIPDGVEPPDAGPSSSSSQPTGTFTGGIAQPHIAPTPNVGTVPRAPPAPAGQPARMLPAPISHPAPFPRRAPVFVPARPVSRFGGSIS